MTGIPSPYAAIVATCEWFGIDPLEVLYPGLPVLEASALEPDDDPPDPLDFDIDFEFPAVPITEYLDVATAQFGPVRRAA